MSYVLAVDLGTTFTAAATCIDGRTDIVSLGNHAATIPSMVFLRDDGAEGDNPGGRMNAARRKGSCQGFGGAELRRRGHAGQHPRHGDVKHRANHKAGQDADGHVALRLAGFLGSSATRSN